MSVTYGNGNYVAIAGGSASTNAAASSTNGSTWNARTLSASSNWNTVRYGNGYFVAVSGASGTVVTQSADGTTWVAGTNTTSAPRGGLAFGNGLFVSVAGGSISTRSAGTVGTISGTGATWSAVTLPASAEWDCICAGGGYFVALAGFATAGTIGGYSMDGSTWTAFTMPTSAKWIDIATDGNGLFVAITGGAANTTAATIVLPPQCTSLGPIYYPVTINANDFQISTTVGGSPVDIQGTETALVGTIRTGAIVDSIVTNTSVTLSSAAVANGTVTLSYRLLDVNAAYLKGWSLTF